MPLFPPLVVEHDFKETGRGYRCVRDIIQGEELLAIPLEECWTAADARAAVQLKPVIDADPELSDVNVTALHLLVERAKGPQSTRWAHLQQLPIEYDSTLFWSTQQLQEIEGSPWHELATRFAEEARQDWATLRDAVARATPESRVLLDGVSERDYLWAYTTVKSRTAEVLVDGEKASLLAPDFDMFNHCDALKPGSTHFFDEPRRALVVSAARDYVEGEQAFISYGTVSNGSLLLAGGFVLPSNRFDYVECPLTTQCDSGRLLLFMMTAPEVGDPAELATFEFLELPTDEDVADGVVVPLVTRHLLTKQVPVPPPLLGYVRLECMSGEEIETAKRKADKQGAPLWELLVATVPLDAINELVSLASLRASFVAMAAAYPTTLAADRLALARGGMAELASRDTVDGRSQAAEDEAAASARRRLLALVLLLTMALLTMALLTMALFTVALLTMALLTMALFTVALLTMALLTMALLTMALLTMAPLTMALLTKAARQRLHERAQGLGDGAADVFVEVVLLREQGREHQLQVRQQRSAAVLGHRTDRMGRRRLLVEQRGPHGEGAAAAALLALVLVLVLRVLPAAAAAAVERC